MKFNKAVPLLPVTDISIAIEFYQSKLGFDCVYNDTVFARMCANDVELYLWQQDVTPASRCRIMVSDLSSLYGAYLTTGAINSATAVVLQPWGQKDFTLYDLCGNIITFCQEHSYDY